MRANGILDKYELGIRKLQDLKDFIKHRDFCDHRKNFDLNLRFLVESWFPHLALDIAEYDEPTSTNSSEARESDQSWRSFEDDMMNLASSSRARRSSLESSRRLDDDLLTDYKRASLPSDVREFVFENLDHFSAYTISVRACLRGVSSSDPTCGSDSSVQTKTLRSETADDIQEWSIDVMPSNQTIRDFKLSWTPPANPNGAVLNYIVKQKRMNDAAFGEKVICISLLNRDSLSSKILEKIEPGNYSFEIAAVTLGGRGKFSEVKFAYIAAPSNFSIIMSPAFLTLMFLVIASVISTFVYMLYKRNVSPDMTTPFESLAHEGTSRNLREI